MKLRRIGSEVSEEHQERGRGAEDEGAAREKGCRGGGRKVSRTEAESRRKGLSVGGEQRPNRSGREGGRLEGGAGRSPGVFLLEPWPQRPADRG